MLLTIIRNTPNYTKIIWYEKENGNRETGSQTYSDVKKLSQIIDQPHGRSIIIYISCILDSTRQLIILSTTPASLRGQN